MAVLGLRFESSLAHSGRSCCVLKDGLSHQCVVAACILACVLSLAGLSLAHRRDLLVTQLHSKQGLACLPKAGVSECAEGLSEESVASPFLSKTCTCGDTEDARRDVGGGRSSWLPL